jgi:hypothetical protein
MGKVGVFVCDVWWQGGTEVAGWKGVSGDGRIGTKGSD